MAGRREKARFVDRDGTFTTVNVPGAAGTLVTSINDLGVTVGYYTDSSGNTHGFVDRGGRFTTINDPHAGTASGQGTFSANMNNLGVIAGFYFDASGVQHGFIDRSGVFTTVDDPHAGTASGQGTSVGYINDFGVVTGSYTDSSGNNVAFAGCAVRVRSPPQERRREACSGRRQRARGRAQPPASTPMIQSRPSRRPASRGAIPPGMARPG